MARQIIWVDEETHQRLKTLAVKVKLFMGETVTMLLDEHEERSIDEHEKKSKKKKKK